MKHPIAILIKWGYISIVLFSILTIFQLATLGEIFVMSILVTGISYIVGDLFILPRFGRIAAAVADFVLISAAIWLLSLAFIGPGTAIIGASLFAGFFIAILEGLFHIYMLDRVIEDSKRAYPYDLTPIPSEFAEEAPVKEDIIELKGKKDSD